jgi:hypothetical protein
MGKGNRKKKAQRARVSDVDDDDDDDGNNKVSSTTQAIEPEDDLTSKTDAQSDHDPEDDWPPGWSDTKKREISPAQWPLNSEQWSLFKKLLKNMGKEKNPTPGSIAKMIGGAGIWDVSHPKWQLERRTGIGNYFHPDKVRLLIEESRKHGVKIDDTFKEELLRLANEAFSGEVTDNLLSEGIDVAQSATARTARKRRRLCKILERRRRRYSARAKRGNLP